MIDQLGPSRQTLSPVTLTLHAASVPQPPLSRSGSRYIVKERNEREEKVEELSECC